MKTWRIKYKNIESEKQQIFGNNEENNSKTSNQCFESQNIGFNNKLKSRRYKKIPKRSETIVKSDNSKEDNFQYYTKGLINEKLEINDNSIKIQLTDNISEEYNSLIENDNQLSDESMTNQTLKRCTISGCDKYFPPKGVNSHLIRDHKNLKEYKCCEITFYSRNSFISHKRSNHCIKKQFECDFNNCGQKFMTELNLNCHKSIHYKVNNQYVCRESDCNFETTVLRSLVEHKYSHLNDKPFKCNIDGCIKTYKRNHDLLFHQRIIHLTDNQYICDEIDCNFKTIYKNNLVLHKQIHSNVKPFKCDFDGCNKTFTTKGSLKKHKEYIHGNTSLLYKCPIDSCNKSFKHKDILKNHMKTHSDNCYSCDWPGCEYSTNVEHNLKMHRRKHQSANNFVCDWPECVKRFKTKENLYQHTRVHLNDKRYVCHWPGCEFRTVHLHSFSQHMKIHTNDKRYVCHWPGCQYKSCQFGNYSQHLKIHNRV